MKNVKKELESLVKRGETGSTLRHKCNAILGEQGKGKKSLRYYYAGDDPDKHDYFDFGVLQAIGVNSEFFSEESDEGIEKWVEFTWEKESDPKPVTPIEIDADLAQGLMVSARTEDFLTKAFESIRKEAQEGNGACFIDMVPTNLEFDKLQELGFGVLLLRDMGVPKGVSISWVYHSSKLKI